MQLNTEGDSNTAVGSYALDANTTADYNTAFGYGTLSENTTGYNNTGIGYNALWGNTTGNGNQGFGLSAGKGITTGQHNVCVGLDAGNYTTPLTTGSYNVYVGNYSVPSAANVEYETTLGYYLTGQGSETVALRGTPYNSANADWGTYSDIRIKKNVTDNKKVLDAINQIRVRNFEYKTKEEILNDSPELTDVIDAAVKEQEGIQVGVVAQELQKVLPELVQEESTTVLSVVPTELKWYLVNAIQELSAKVEELNAKVTALEAG